jgi:putative component of toxin-antitoxin plasmid stabilization module
MERCGGDKRTQDKDIEDAKGYFKDFKLRTAKPPDTGRT